MAGAEKRTVTLAEHRDLERTGADQHEYADGRIFARAGASAAHNRVSANVIAELSIALRERPCTVYPSDQRIVTVDGTAAYPDVSALCGEPRFGDEQQDELLNPTLVVEVLSESTEAYDRGMKFEHYASMPSFIEYVLIDPHRMHVEVFTREDEGWRLRRYGAEDTLELLSVGCVLRVRELYVKVPGIETA